MRKHNPNVMGAFLGTIVEYYDYSLYGFSAGVLASKFFISSSENKSLLYVFAIYAIAYTAKPLGSLVFGRYGDLYGRKNVLKLTMLGIVIPTFTIGLLPDYNTFGSFSAYALMLCRFIQGFFIGGEYDGAAIYTIEHLGKKYHYTASALTRMSGSLGLLLGIFITNFFNSSLFLNQWSWRVPFFLSLPFALISVYYRKYLIETPDFKKTINNKVESYNTTIVFIQKRWRAILIIILLSGSFGVSYQISVILMKYYLPMVIDIRPKIITSFSIVLVLVFTIAIPVSGLLTDKFGILFINNCSLIGSLISTIGFIVAIKYTVINLLLISSLLLVIFVAPFNAISHGVVVKLFSIKERYRGIALGHAIGSMLISGSANYISLLMMRKLQIKCFPILYLSFFVIISYIIIRGINKKISKN